jgi:S-DNA-T family DNA segregation ATPase FtsK/SpoIIIE
VHGALVTTEEVERVVEFIRAQPPASEDFRLPDPELTKIKPGGVEAAGGVNSSDEYFEEAARIVVKVDQGSVSILQRRLRVGYSRAARLIDELEQAGIVGPFDGSKARQVLVTPEELEERYGITI